MQLRKRLVRTAFGFGAAVAAVACAATPSTFDGSQLAANIQKDASATELELTNVQCPSPTAVKVDDVFQCSGSLPGGARVVYDVRITSPSGAYSYALAPNQTFDGDAVATELTQDIASSAPAFSDAKVSCPKTVISPGGTAAFECTLMALGRSQKLAVTKVAGQPPTWRIQ